MKRTFTLLFFFFYLQAFSQTYQGKIISVIDGDTFIFQTQEGSLNIRMTDIDAPEKAQDYGKESKAFLEKFVNQKATVIGKGTDRYGRTLGTLFIDSKNINLESVETGNAWHYVKYSTDTTFANAEALARANKIGLWKEEGPEAPWEFRKNH